MTSANPRRSQETYNADRHKRVRFEPSFEQGHSVFIEIPPLSTSPAERPAAERYTKLLPRRLGPNCIISVGPEYVKIMQDGIESTVSNNRIPRVPRANRNKAATSLTKHEEQNSEKQPNEQREKPRQG